MQFVPARVFASFSTARIPIRSFCTTSRPSSTSAASTMPSQPTATSSRGPSGSRPNDFKAGSKGEPMTPILSASLIVLCPSQSNKATTSSSNQLPVSTLMLLRSARVGSSFRSAVVFPGGALDRNDEYSVGCPAEVSDQDDVTNEQYVEALKLCALRETFEETGLVLLPSGRATGNKGVPWSKAVGAKDVGMSEQEWKRYRDLVHDDASHFPSFLKNIAAKLGLTSQQQSCRHTLPLPHFSYYSHWITPKSVVRPGKRFSAHFFVTCLDGSDELSAAPSSSDSSSSSLSKLSADGTETTHLRLAPVTDFLDRCLQDEMVLYPPQFYILADLAQMTTVNVSNSNSKDWFESQVKEIQPLAFDGPQQQRSQKMQSLSSASSSAIPTAVEEEPRDLPKGQNYAWDRGVKEPMGWVSDKKGGKVSAIEPRPIPSQGRNVLAGDFSRKDAPSGAAKEKPKSEDEEEDIPFVFPLVLPGDHQASKTPPSSSRGRQPSLNRIYVSPRSPSQGGGLIPRGAVRRNVGGLKDWTYGVDVKDEPEDSQDKAKL